MNCWGFTHQHVLKLGRAHGIHRFGVDLDDAVTNLKQTWRERERKRIRKGRG